jgi:hypothetical protein
MYPWEVPAYIFYKETIMARQSFIPTSHMKYDKFFKYIIEYLVRMCDAPKPTWTHIPQAERTALSDTFPVTQG